MAQTRACLRRCGDCLETLTSNNRCQRRGEPGAVLFTWSAPALSLFWSAGGAGRARRSESPRPARGAYPVFSTLTRARAATADPTPPLPFLLFCPRRRRTQPTGPPKYSTLRSLPTAQQNRRDIPRPRRDARQPRSVMSGRDRYVTRVVGHLISQGLLERWPCLTALDVGVHLGKSGHQICVPDKPQHCRHENVRRSEAIKQIIAAVDPLGKCG